MKKFFTLLTVMAAALTANAQTWQVSDADAAAGSIAAGTSLIQSRKAIVKTHFDANTGVLMNEEGAPMTATVKGYPFKNYVQVRVDAAPTAAEPTGTDKGGSTPLIVEAKQDLNLTFYYRRQAADNKFTAGDGKDLQCVNQAGIAKQQGDLTVDTDLGTGYAYCYQTYHLLAGNVYTVYGRGTTIQMYGFDVEDYTAPVVDEPEPTDATKGTYAFEDAAVVDGFSTITYKDGAAMVLSGNADKAWSKGSSITVEGESLPTIKVSNGAQNTFVAPEGKYVTKAVFYSYVNKDAEARTPYWKEVNGVDYTTLDETGAVVPSADAVIMKSYKDFANPDVITFDLGGVPSFTFTNTGEQVCFVLYVEYGAKAIVGGPVYSWESNGEVSQFGGTIVNTGDERDNVNYLNSVNGTDYYTICVRGKKANINDQNGTANASRIELTLDGGFKAGDQIAITGYYNKGEQKTVTLYMVFAGNGVEIADNGPWYDIMGADAPNTAPTTNVYDVPAEADGQQTLYMTRASAGTNLFITKLQVVREGASAGIHEVKAERGNQMYNLYGQKVNAAKGFVILNGQKAIIR